VDGLPALGLAAGELSGEGRILGPAPDRLLADADLSGDCGGGMTGERPAEVGSTDVLGTRFNLPD